jgi:hypothetical protein
MNMLEIVKEVFKVESNEVFGLTKLLTEDFKKAVKSILDCNGKVIIVGMVKSGIVGKKIAATMASTGMPRFFMHPGEYQNFPGVGDIYEEPQHAKIVIDTDKLSVEESTIKIIKYIKKWVY